MLAQETKLCLTKISTAMGSLAVTRIKPNHARSAMELMLMRHLFHVVITLRVCSALRGAIAALFAGFRSMILLRFTNSETNERKLILFRILL